MKLHFTEGFLDELSNLPPHIQLRVQKALRQLVQDFRYPSLQVKKMKGYSGIWEARVTEGYRFTFRIEREYYVLRRVGKHEIEDQP